ncbi:hypothetical protein [Haladaptatus salinisoli]|uniref:hypothetical protein n=1 Tax=Haladaptatus salinisoli TaxID=2884876 RepID=UPI001D0A8D5A|nr:hypothetical protein [Haladaptatus salinisoli]
MSARRDRFWDFICVFSSQAYVFLAVSVALFFFSVYAWFNSPSPGTRALIPLTVAILSVNIVVLYAIIRRCQSRDL